MPDEEDFERQQQNLNNSLSSNREYMNATALQFRLDTQIVLDSIEYFLRGSKAYLDTDAAGNTQLKEIQTGEAKANKLGIQSILSYISAIINPQVVQGNFGKFEDGRYDDYMYRVHLSLAKLLVINRINWKIEPEEISFIISFIMNLIEPFMTRLIENAERDSYNNTFKTVESNTLQQQQTRGGFGLFRRK